MQEYEHLLKSPFQRYCEQLDRTMFEKDLSPEEMETIAFKNFNKSRDYMRKALIEDMKFRNRYRLNYIVGAEGAKGTGKSMLTADVITQNAIAFNSPFNFDHLYYTPDEFTEKMPPTENKTIHWLDEAKKKKVGVGSKRVDLEIEDYQEMLRKTGKCFYWCSPELPLAQYDILFNDYDIERKVNKKCVDCKNIDKCFNLPKQTDTLCKIPFYERLGYPESIIFKILTWNKNGKLFIVRGYYVAPMPDPKFILEYDRHKDKFLEGMKTGADDTTFEQFKDLANKIIKERKEDLLIKNKKGKTIPAQTSIIEAIIYEQVGGMRNYTTKEISILKSVVINNLLKNIK